MIFVIGKRAMEDTQPVDDNDGEPQASQSVRAYEYYGETKFRYGANHDTREICSKKKL
jgi:hypothetical protein